MQKEWTYIVVAGRDVVKMRITPKYEPNFGAINDNRPLPIERAPTYMGKPVLEVS